MSTKERLTTRASISLRPSSGPPLTMTLCLCSSLATSTLSLPICSSCTPDTLVSHDVLDSFRTSHRTQRLSASLALLWSVKVEWKICCSGGCTITFISTLPFPLPASASCKVLEASATLLVRAAAVLSQTVLILLKRVGSS